MAVGAWTVPAHAQASLTLTMGTAIQEQGNGRSEATIGEEVALAVRATLPAGALDAATVVVRLPAGLVTTDEAPSVRLDGAGLPAASVVDVVADAVTVTLPAGHDTGDGQGLLVRVVARVADVPAAVHGAVLRPTAEMVLAPAGGDPETVVGTWAVTVVEPAVRVGLSEDTPFGVGPGSDLNFFVEFSNTGSTAHDVVAVVTFEPRLHPRGEDGPARDGEVLPATDGVWDLETRTVTWQRGSIANGYQHGGLMSVDVASGVVHVPDRALWVGSATLTSLGGDVPGERTPASGVSVDRYAPSATQWEAYFLPAPAANAVEPDGVVSRGDVLTVTEEFAIPRGTTTNDLTLLETVPDGLEYLGTDSAECVTPGCALEVVPLETDGARVGWFVGDVTSPEPTQRRVVVRFRVLVTATAPLETGLVFDPRVGVNGADLLEAPASPPPDASFEAVARDEYVDPPEVWVDAPEDTVRVGVRAISGGEPGNGYHEATIGEKVQVNGDVLLPVGQVVTSAEVRLTLPEGMERTSRTSRVYVHGVSLPPGWRATGTEDGVTLTFQGRLDTTETRTVWISYEARVTDSAAAVHGAVLTPVLDVALEGDRGTQVLQALGSVPVVEPELGVRVVTDPPAGPLARGSVVTHLVEPTSAGVPAHDVTVVMTVDPALVALGADGRPAADGGVVSSAGGVWDADARTVTWSVRRVAPADRPRLELRTRVLNGDGASSATSTVVATATSRAGRVSTERDAQSAVNAERYRAEREVVLELVPGPALRATLGRE